MHVHQTLPSGTSDMAEGNTSDRMSWPYWRGWREWRACQAPVPADTEEVASSNLATPTINDEVGGYGL